MQILEETDIRRLKRHLFLGKVGWGLATILLALVAFLVGNFRAISQHKQDFITLKDEVKQIQEQQAIVNDKFIEAWKGQNRLAETLVAWSDLLKNKSDIINENRKPKLTQNSP